MIDSYWLHFLDLSWPLSVLCKHLSKWWERPVIIVVFKVFRRPLYPPVTQPWSFFWQQWVLSMVLGAGNQQRLRPCRVQKHCPKRSISNVQQRNGIVYLLTPSQNGCEWIRRLRTFWYNNLFCSACKFAVVKPHILRYFTQNRLSNLFGPLEILIGSMHSLGLLCMSQKNISTGSVFGSQNACIEPSMWKQASWQLSSDAPAKKSGFWHLDLGCSGMTRNQIQSSHPKWESNRPFEIIWMNSEPLAVTCKDWENCKWFVFSLSRRSWLFLGAQNSHWKISEDHWNWKKSLVDTE